MSEKKEEAKPAAEAKAADGHAAPAKSGGIGAFLPLIISVVLMPVLSVVTTKFLILPKVTQARETPHGEEGEEHAEEGGHGKEEKKAEGHGKEPKKEEGGHGKEAKKEEGGHGKDDKGAHGKSAAGKKKQTYQLTKMIVNVAGSMGTRYLLTSATLVGGKPDFKDVLEENKDQILDAAIGVLTTKTITDLEKPGARNQLRAELISVFNNALGSSLIQEIYFTEFAIQ